MATFKKKKKSASMQVNTSSLPDIIFMLLFFFMVSTTMKETDTKVKINPVKATEIENIERKDLTTYIYIGVPTSSKLGTTSRIQLNDDLSDTEHIQNFIIGKRDVMAEASLMLVNLKVDKETQMGVVSDVKEALRKAKQYKIMYSAVDDVKKNR